MRILGVSVLGLLELVACSRELDEARHTEAAFEDRLRPRDVPPVVHGKEPATPDRRHGE